MRYLIISDIHSNLGALDAVLDSGDAAGYDRLVVLGDLVGYGAQPNDVVERLRALEPFAIIRGNHDKVACGLDDSENFNPVAQESASWTYGALTEENRAYLAGCPRGPLEVEPGVQICHGSPDDEDAYITSEAGARHILERMQAGVCFYGHTHIPVVFRLSVQGFDWVGSIEDEAVNEMVLEPGTRYLINPGSVGQPRDGDARAAFAVFDAERRTVTRYRVAYAVEEAQARIIAAGLPPALARRLALGR
ncbi:MAG: metallophosphoesterase family protein [Bacteroidales bacterium]